MEFRIVESFDTIEADAVAVPVLEDATTCDARFAAQAKPLFAGGDLPLKPFETLLIPGTPKLLFVGVSRSADADSWRKTAAAVVRRVKNVRRLAFAAGDVRALVEGAIIGAFSVEAYKTTNHRPPVETVFFRGGSGGDSKAIHDGTILAESMNWARGLINEPSNRKPPRVIADRAKEMAAAAGLSFEVLDERAIRDLNMGALIGVGQGSSEPPRLVVLKYMGKPSSSKLLAFVGKGVTFDTGGISLKPADGMEKMKYDMAGGVTAMAALRTLALLHAKVNCMAVVPLVENMPGGNAQRPGDVVHSMSGKTIEIINTDAEGRLILSDALAYARRMGATHLVDLATLTGAARIALGPFRVGVMGNEQSYIDAFLAAARRAGEKMWQMPMDDDYRELLKSTVADIANTGGRYAGMITAAKFLQEFVGDTPWVHLDIASTAWNEEDKPYLPKGPSGVAMRSLVEFALTGYE
ncbi:MAG TPA: leucyl aminopeptidase [Terriglobia bacterium]